MLAEAAGGKDSIAASAACAVDRRKEGRAGGGDIVHRGCGAPASANASVAVWGGSTDSGAPAAVPGAWGPWAAHDARP